MSEKEISRYTRKEELANSLTHGFALLLSFVGLVNLVVQATIYGETIHLVTVNIYGASMIFLFAASTVYHGVTDPELKHVCRVVDHASIYVLIAGTYTPISLTVLPSDSGWPIFIAIWAMAIVGLIMKLFFTGKFNRLSTALYIGMGWMAIIGIHKIWQAMEPGGFILMVAGGLAYTLGVIFYRWKSLAYHHTIWHIFVMAGAACHYLMVAIYAIPGKG